MFRVRPQRDLAFVVVAALLVFPAAALADGAFPAPARIFAPAGRPQELTVTTNFGLVATRDGGRTWTWTCEHGLGDLGYLYQQAAPPGHRFWAAVPLGLAYSDDDACTWGVTNGLPAGALVADYFADPGDGQRLLIILRTSDSFGNQTSALYLSSDGGATFANPPLYQAPADLRLESVEVTPAAPDRIYLTAERSAAAGGGPWLLRSDDRGRNFSITDVSATAGPGLLRIAAVDAADADRVYFRSTGTTDRLLITTDGGASFRAALVAEGAMQLSAFLRRQDAGKTLLVATMDGLTGELFRSTDQGLSFEMLPDNLHVGSFVERDGVLYALGDGITDPFLVGTSRDNGASFQPLVSYADIAGVKACPADLRPTCQSSCDNLQNAGLFNPAICQTLAGTVSGDAGTDGATDSAAGDAGDAGAPPRPGTKSGCGCAMEEGGAAEPGVIAVALAVLMLLRRRPSS